MLQASWHIKLTITVSVYVCKLVCVCVLKEGAKVIISTLGACTSIFQAAR